ncbi:MAG: hypothetical protein LBP85_06235 [Prevotellaceae bacterium]|jgi:glucose uptake protein GlcU|nr:hypothetical protein [Prevotellaceae bacterium]
MKKIVLKTVALLLILAGMIIACGKEKEDNKICDCTNKTNPIEVIDTEGIVNFNADIQEWYIAVMKKIRMMQ